MPCGANFKYVCKYKNLLDAEQSHIDEFKDNFVDRYKAYEIAVNNVLTQRDPAIKFSNVVNSNYNIYHNIMLDLEALKNEISKSMQENSSLMDQMDSSINKSKKFLGGVSEKMNSLSDRASGSHQSYKNELGMYRRDAFSILAFLCAGGGIYYSAYLVFADNL